MWLYQPEVIMCVPLLIHTSKKVETFLETQAFHILLMRVSSSLHPHDPLLLEPAITLIVPILLIANSIDCVVLSKPDYIRVNLIIVKVLVINALYDFRSFWSIVDLVLDPLLVLKVKESEIIEKPLLLSVVATVHQHEASHD
jgi:hypothetical protein